MALCLLHNKYCIEGCLLFFFFLLFCTMSDGIFVGNSFMVSRLSLISLLF